MNMEVNMILANLVSGLGMAVAIAGMIVLADRWFKRK